MTNLNKIIPPEISNNSFYEAIKILAKNESIQTILEIGSSVGMEVRRDLSKEFNDPKNKIANCIA